MSRSPEELFAPGPARDSRFTVRTLWSEMDNYPADDPRKDLEFLHRQMNEEVNSIEMCARSLTDFPDAEWELRMELARQCWDEARHVVAFRELFERRGGVMGQFPIMNFQYCIITNLRSLAGRLAVQNRSFEAAGLDAIQDGLAEAKRANDPEFTSLFEAQLADEMHHVRYANEWVKKLLKGGGPRAVFDLARDVALANEGLRYVSGGGVMFYPVADDLRREVGFTDEEIEAARAQAGLSL